MSNNAVANAILNNPWKEPTRYYDFTGPAPQIVDGRRAAGYHGTIRTKTEDGPQITHQPFPLPLVNDIRRRVAEWRSKRFPNVTPTTRDLLEHWSRSDRQSLFFCQREAVETIIWLTEATPADRQGITVPIDAPADANYAPLTRYCTKMATGSGKTIVMAMVAAWSVLNKAATRQDARFSDVVLIVGPNLTVKERLAVLDPKRDDNYYDAFDLVPRGYRELLARGRVFVTNWHVFAVKDDSTKRGVVQRGQESDVAFTRRVLGKDLGGSAKILVLNDEAHHAYRPKPVDASDFEDMSADEREEAKNLAEEATVWVGGLDRIHKVRGIQRVIDLSATPFYIRGAGYTEGTPLPWIVSDFGLVDAIESGITKIPRVPVADDSGRPVAKYFHLWQTIMKELPPSDRESVKKRAKPDAVWDRAHGACTTLAAKWKAKLDEFRAADFKVPPAMIVVAANTNLSRVVAEALKRGDVLDELAGENTFAIDSRVLAEAEAAEEGGKDRENERLRLKTSTIGKATWAGGRAPEGWDEYPTPPGKDVRCVVSVGMLTEGWDATNVTQILGLRAFGSQLLCEQVVGRGLRRMSYVPDSATGLLPPEYCDVFGIPFEVVPVQGATVGPNVEPPSTLVQAIEERKQLAIEFPRVEGFIRDVKSRIRCDVDQIPPLKMDLRVEPTATITRTDLGWVVGNPRAGGALGDHETLTRALFHEEHRVQRTVFEIARDITEKLAQARADAHTAKAAPADRALFPQVLDVVRRYVNDRIDVATGAHVEDIALAQYRKLIIERLIMSIEPATDEGESTLLPRIERFRRFGSTADVQFRTWKPAQATTKSHISHVVLDSTWEGSVAYHLERIASVYSYARNERLDFKILYEWQGDPTTEYIPDFLIAVDLEDGRRVTLILEVKGNELEQDRAKWTAAKQWVRAVNNHGGFGLWDFRVTKSPSAIITEIDQWRKAELAMRTGRRGAEAPASIPPASARGWANPEG